MTMLIHELPPQECREFVRRATVGRLACAHDGQPYIVPISYSFDAGRDCLYGFSPVGQKVTWMRANPKVCVEIEDVSDPMNWTTVVIFGRYEEIGEADGDRDARGFARELFELRPNWWLPGAARVPGHEHTAVVLFRIAIDRITGRRTSRSPAEPPGSGG